MMKQLLIPSRHIIYSKEQYNALREHLLHTTYDCIIFAVTSSNLNNCKYSPIELHHRISMIEHLVFDLQKEFSFKHKIVCLPHYPKVDAFAERIVKSVNLELSEGVDKDSTHVFAFGTYIGKLFTEAGYTTYSTEGVNHVTLFKELFENNNQTFFDNEISAGGKEVLDNQPEILLHVKKIWNDTILKETGSITENRNYNVYTYGMSNTQMIEVKYKDIQPYIIEGKITDEGCADAALFVPIARDFPDSDLIGVDISNDFVARVHENIRRGLFGGSFVSIIQANLMEKIFDDNTINTTLCNSTMHEVWSYNNKRASVEAYLELKYKQLCEGGRILIRDVIGPSDKNKVVYLRSLEDEGNEHFKQFVKDFKHVREEDTVEEVTLHGQMYAKTTLKLVSEYLLHKDYRDNWESEMNEEFCHFNVEDWRTILLENQFRVITIESYRSEWIYENRYKGKVEVLAEEGETVEFPDTNVVVVAEK